VIEHGVSRLMAPAAEWSSATGIALPFAPIRDLRTQQRIERHMATPGPMDASRHSQDREQEK